MLHWKKIIPGLFACLALAMVAASPAHAQTSRLYFSGYLGLNTHFQNEYSEDTTRDSGSYQLEHAPSFAGALGLRLTRNFRLEGEISYRNAGIDNFDSDFTASRSAGVEVKSWMYLLNAYYDFDVSWKNFTPFVGAGIGLASHEARILDTTLPVASDSSLNLAYQVGGGLKYRYSDDLAFTGGYRYVGTTDIEADSYDLGYSSHEIRVGLEYDLPAGWWE